VHDDTSLPTGLQLTVVKGHGTHNDFVLIDDRDDQLDLTAAMVRALADRRGGLGGDGVIRLVGSRHLPEGRAVLDERPDAAWFMDYRNADGSIAQMCGNGVRVLAALCDRLGLWSEGELVVATRAGARPVRRVEAPDGGTWYEVAMGPVEVLSPGATAPTVQAPGLDEPAAGWGVDVGNPHLVVPVDAETLAAVDLSRAPAVSPTPPDGVNVELVVDLTPPGAVSGRVVMRVHERGVGETMSCGTGVCAAAAAVRSSAGPDAPSTWTVDVPGGVLRVRLEADGAHLAGPAVLVADAVVDLGALAR
jgi:diaminopimelate epimerase